MKKLFKQQQEYLNLFFNQLDCEQAEKILEVCLNTKGLIIITGVGKSGFVAEKIAMTLSSTGTRAIYLSPMNFLHGDLGIVSEIDTVMLLSKSGETEELLRLIPFIKKKQAKLIACVSNPNSRLARQADETMILPFEQELCPFDLTPTISTELQLLFGDVIAVALMQRKGFTTSYFMENHPAGSIGKKITLTVEDIMLPMEKLPCCLISLTVAEALKELTDKRLGCILIVDEDKKFQGIFTDGDLRRSLQSIGVEIMQKKIADLMTIDALVIHKKELAWNALKIMQKNPNKWIMMLPVLESEKVVGLVRMHDIIHEGIY
ncbi:MAG: KpsF/GutQ family sugar-phosphate isomerase [Candidatus Woesearchaeota archaeon]|nr:KpsF/GutQ family sugar-phosphate isomerase [Candidatus Woesearchaeota archaeon]